MKSYLPLIVCMLFAVSPVFAEEKQELKTQKDKLSYAVGLDMGASLKKNGIEVDPDVVARAIKDVQSGSKLLMTDEEVKAVIVAVQKDIRAKLRKKNEDFLAENRKKKGVKVLPSGLQYKVITEGKGRSPKATDTVTVNYRGTLIDGTEFDSSFKRGQPATFPVNAVISGWAEALQLMKPGSQWQLFIPANLAYGDVGRPGIPPNAALLFEIELVSIKEQ